MALNDNSMNWRGYRVKVYKKPKMKNSFYIDDFLCYSSVFSHFQIICIS